MHVFMNVTEFHIHLANMGANSSLGKKIVFLGTGYFTH